MLVFRSATRMLANLQSLVERLRSLIWPPSSFCEVCNLYVRIIKEAFDISKGPCFGRLRSRWVFLKALCAIPHQECKPHIVTSSSFNVMLFITSHFKNNETDGQHQAMLMLGSGALIGFKSARTVHTWGAQGSQ